MLPGADVFTDEEFLDFAGREGQSAYHPVGTCRMGHDPRRWSIPGSGSMGLKACGSPTPRDADAWYLGDTNAACMMIGEKASDLILADAQR